MTADDDDREEFFVITAGGDRIDLDDPKPHQFRIGPVAKALSQLNRFSGNTVIPISVAWHAINVADELAENDASAPVQLFGLLHDVHEIATSDIPTPVKRLLRKEANQNCGCSPLDHLQQRLDVAVMEGLGLTPALRRSGLSERQILAMVHLCYGAVRIADGLVTLRERASYLSESEHWPITKGVTTYPRPPREAEEVARLFEERFVELLDKTDDWAKTQRAKRVSDLSQWGSTPQTVPNSPAVSAENKRRETVN